MEQVKIQISPKQMSKLRNGHKVRIKKPSMEGSGVGIMVNPGNFSNITRAFTKNKGSEIVLSPQEILANREQAPEMEGGGIFGKTFDKKAEKLLGKKGKKQLYQYAKEVLNPVAKGALTAGLGSVAVTNPELIPFLAPALPMAFDYLDRPSSYQSNAGGPRAKKYLNQQALNELNAQLGTNMGNLSKAGLEQAIQDKVSQQLTTSSIQLQRQLLERLASGMENIASLSADEKMLLRGTPYEYMIGSGLYPMSGSGLYPMSGNGLYASNKRGGAIVGNNGGFVKRQPQALQSQPNSANFQFRYTLPINLQKMM
jgi:hypothetical protein